MSPKRLLPREPISSKVGTIAPVRTQTQLVADALRDSIVDGRLGPGERIKELPLARHLGVSRGPIREALRLLEHDGLLTLIPNRGAVVPRPTPGDVLEVYALRATLGSLALHKLMLGSTLRELDALERPLEQLERAVQSRRAARAADADLAYQSTVVSLADLPRVARQFDQLTWQVRIFIGTMKIRYEDKLPQILTEVSQLHGAILAGDRGRAEQLWREKFERWVRDFIDQMGQGFDRDLWIALTKPNP